MEDPEGLIVKSAEPYPLLTSAKAIRLDLDLVKKIPLISLVKLALSTAMLSLNLTKISFLIR